MRGTQAEGVAATVKHFVLNSQETKRNTQASEVDARTLHEVYYPLQPYPYPYPYPQPQPQP